MNVPETARVDAAVGPVDGLDARLESKVDEVVVVRVPGFPIDDFAGAAASKQPLGAETIRTNLLQSFRVD